jgi:hypothetical protein
MNVKSFKMEICHVMDERSFTIGEARGLRTHEIFAGQPC